ncbi:hypothetical protein [Actinokineospora sp.]|uniref:hypothetical protein n=1 Tax=Actinokineospora sp. TaxID=1872133 RepID=UPI0040377BA3
MAGHSLGACTTMAMTGAYQTVDPAAPATSVTVAYLRDDPAARAFLAAEPNPVEVAGGDVVDLRRK